MISLVNKTFFVTGLGSGIGYETGKLIKSLGGNLTGTIENEDQKKDILPLTEDIFLLDLNDSEKLQSAIQAAAKKYQGLDGLVGAAGIIKLKTFDATTSQELDQTLDVNLKANFKLAQFANSSLKSGASLIFISSQIGLVGHDNAAAYAASKAGLNGFAKSYPISFKVSLTMDSKLGFVCEVISPARTTKSVLTNVSAATREFLSPFKRVSRTASDI